MFNFIGHIRNYKTSQMISVIVKKYLSTKIFWRCFERRCWEHFGKGHLSMYSFEMNIYTCIQLLFHHFLFMSSHNLQYFEAMKHSVD